MDKNLPAEIADPRPADLWDRTEDRSVINLVPNAVAAAMIDASKSKPELFGLDERDLFAALKRMEKTPSPTDNRLRMAFWLEYDRSQMEMKPMNMTNVFAGVCTKQLFYGNYLHSAERVAWLLCPPVKYIVKIEEALDFGLDRMRDILSIPVQEPGRPVNVKLAELQAKIVAMLDQRSKGAVTQRIEQRNMNLNISTNDKKVAQAAVENSMVALEKRLKELERRERASQNLPGEKNEPIDVTAYGFDPGGEASS